MEASAAWEVGMPVCWIRDASAIRLGVGEAGSSLSWV